MAAKPLWVESSSVSIVVVRLGNSEALDGLVDENLVL